MVGATSGDTGSAAIYGLVSTPLQACSIDVVNNATTSIHENKKEPLAENTMFHVMTSLFCSIITHLFVLWTSIPQMLLFVENHGACKSRWFGLALVSSETMFPYMLRVRLCMPRLIASSTHGEVCVSTLHVVKEEDRHTRASMYDLRVCAPDIALIFSCTCSSSQRGKKNVECFILFPEGRVSEIQQLQMTSVLDPNVHCVAVQGTFDDCQDIVKALFRDCKQTLPFFSLSNERSG